MFITVIVVSITPMLLVSGIILYQFHASYKEKILAHLETLVNKHKRTIDSFLEEKLAEIRFLAKAFSFEELGDESFLRDRLETLQQVHGPDFVDLGVVNSQGVQMAYAGPFRLEEAHYSESDWFQNAMRRKYIISDVFLGLRGLPHFIVAVKEDWMGAPYILRATIDFAAFNDLVQNIQIGRTGFAYILNKEGELQTKTRLEVLPTTGPCREWVQGERAICEDMCICESEDEEGIGHLYVGAYLKNGDWLLMFRQRLSDVFSDFRKSVEVTLILLCLGGISIITMAYILSKRMARRVSEVDMEKQMMNEQIVETGKLASVGELAAGIAHEINNPVAIMVEEAGWIEDLLQEEEFKSSENMDEFRRALVQIATQGRRCKEITHKLLSFARKTDATVQEVQINDVIDEIVSLSNQRARVSNVSINTDLQTNLPTLRVSPSEMQQVFLNMINNSLDAMEKQGGTITIRSLLKDNTMVIEIADNGPGIPSADLGRIFDPFYTTKPVGQGTGLGLSICYGIIKKLGGDIEVTSTLDEGTTFYVKIPLEENESM